MTGPQLTREGVRIFLHAAHRSQTTADALLGMYRRRKNRQTVEAKALLHAGNSAELVLWEDVDALLQRGGLLHLGCVVVDRTPDGQYVVRGAA